MKTILALAGCLAFLIIFSISKATSVSIEGVVGMWLLNEGQGKEVKDISGNENHGELRGNAKWAKSGKFGGALELDGSSSFEVLDSSSLHITDKITLMAWVFPKVTGWGGIISKGDDVANHDDYALWYNSGKIQMTFNWPEEGVGAGGPNVGNTAFPLNEWAHFAGTWDGNQIKVYINGKLDGTFDHPNPIKATNANFYVGVDPGGGDEFFNGVVDEVAVFHKSLSEKEINQLMEGFEKAGAAVSPARKLTTAWGRIKSHL
jgi:hypothetical protein